MFEGIAERILKTKDYAKLNLWLPKLILKLILMWPDSRNKIQNKQKIMFILMIVICMFNLYGMYNFITLNCENIAESLTAVPFFVSHLQVSIKLSVLYYYQDSLKIIIEVILDKFWPSNMMGKKLEHIIKQDYYSILIKMISLTTFFVSFFIAFLLNGILKTKMELLFKTSYPFDISSSPKFEIIYLLQCYTFLNIISTIVCGVNMLFMSICTCITSQYKLLQNAFLKLGTNEMKDFINKQNVEDENKEICTNVEKKFLSLCINHHCLLLRTTRKVEQVFNVVCSLQLGFSIAGICISSFLLSMENVEFEQLVSLGIFVSGHITELFFYCSGATGIVSEMEKLPLYIFSSLWYRTNLKTDIILALKMSQEIKPLTALKIFPVNYETFIQAMRISFSFHTLLSVLTDKK